MPNLRYRVGDSDSPLEGMIIAVLSQGKRTRTSDLLLPEQALYQTELHPDSHEDKNSIIANLSE